MKAVIAGGGIAGLTVALCLKQQGWQVQVLEQAPVFSEVGAGLQLSPNACKVFAALGLMRDLEALAFAPEKIEMRIGSSGRQIFAIPLQDAAVERWGQQYLHIHRADLMQLLIKQFDASTLTANAAVVAYRNSSDRVEAILDDGSSVAADILIGADGIRSTIRGQMLGDDQPRFTGNVAWRAVVPTMLLGELAPPPSACLWTGRGRHAVTYRLRGGVLSNLVAVVERSHWESESWTEIGRKEDAIAAFESFHPIVKNLLEHAEEHFRWALFDRSPLEKWSDDRVVLVGDACHPMLPFVAQGAAQAIEDAWTLADCLKTATPQATSIEQAFSEYFRRRIDRTTRVQAESRANQKRFHYPDWAYWPLWLAARLAPKQLQARQDWLYGHDLVS